MNVLDENIPEDQRQLLRSWKIRTRQIGQDVGQAGMKDEQQIIPLLLQLSRPTFFTRDLDFCDPGLCHDEYSLVCLNVSADEAASFIRRVLRHPKLQTKAKRLGKIVEARHSGIRIRAHHGAEERFDW